MTNWHLDQWNARQSGWRYDKNRVSLDEKSGEGQRMVDRSTIASLVSGSRGGLLGDSRGSKWSLLVHEWRCSRGNRRVRPLELALSLEGKNEARLLATTIQKRSSPWPLFVHAFTRPCELGVGGVEPLHHVIFSVSLNCYCRSLCDIVLTYVMGLRNCWLCFIEKVLLYLW